MAPSLSGPARACAPALALALALAVAPLRVLAEGEPRADPASVASTAADAAASRDADLPTLDEIVVVGRRPRGQVARDPTASATVIEASRFAGEAKGVAELVATAPGVAVNDYGGLGHVSTISIRGASSDGVLVLLDGIPLNSAFGGGVDLGSIPRNWIERIEVVRGVEGAVYGAGALGGVVNIVTRRATASGGSLELGGGSFGSWTGAGDRAFAVGAATVRIAASAETTRGDFPYRWDPTPNDGDPTLTAEKRSNNDAARVGALLAVNAPLGTPVLDVVAQVAAGRRGLPGSPYSLTPDDRQREGRALLALRLSGPGPAAGLALGATASGRIEGLDTDATTGDARQRGGTAGLETEARWTHGVGLLRVALDAREEVVQDASLGERRARIVLAASAAEDVCLGPLLVSPAVRAERIGPHDGWSAKLGASLRLAGPVSLRASGGRSFRAPSFSELFLRQGIVAPNPNLVPEEGIGGDAAVVIDAGPVYASAGGHSALYRDLIVYQPVSFGQLRPFNAGKALVQALELEVATIPLRQAAGLALSASYTLLATQILRGAADTVGNELAHRARHRLYARASAAPGPVGLHLEVHHVSRQYADAQNLGLIPAATVWNAGVSLLLSRVHAVSLHVDVRNLLDDRALQDAFGYPLPGRSVLLLVRAGSPAPEGRP
ncbi:MAG TPA: TonB-dependent receptor [Anaeromyxobacter sp.]